MPQDLKGLIDKIQEEGVHAAEQRAAEIEQTARRKADALLAAAKKEAETIVQEARSQNEKLETSTNAELKQAARDTLIALRKEILNVLAKVIAADVRKALSPEELAGIVRGLIKEFVSAGDSATVRLNPRDLNAVENTALAGLSHEVRQGVTLKTSDDIRGGFLISFDAGKSYFNFTDQALADYLTLHVSPKISDVLKAKT